MFLLTALSCWLTAFVMSRGLYFLANDATYDLAIAFLASFRSLEPDTEIAMIPFDDNTRKIKGLCSRYNFSVFSNPSLFAKCDRVSQVYHGKTLGHYRKLAMWDGPFNEFIYIDIDTVVLSPLSFAFKFLNEYDFVTSHSNIAGSRQFVWKESASGTGLLSAAEFEYAASTGFVASRKGQIDLNRLERLAEEGQALKSHMATTCAEQPFLNYAMVRSSRRYTSLFCLALARPEENIPHESWGADKNWTIAVRGNSYYGGKLTPVLFVHWAGEWAPIGWEKKIYDLLRKLGLRDLPVVRRNMAKKEVWQHFFNKHRDEALKVQAQPDVTIELVHGR